jgi:Mn2+/Fe2+ NRAMP family transporter
MDAVDILAIVFSVLALAKLLICLLDPQTGLKASEELLKQPSVATIIYLILTAAVGYLVFTNLSGTQIGAALLFSSLLMGLSIAPHSKEALEVARRICNTREEVLRKNWLSMVVWAIVAVWVLLGVIRSQS